MNDLNVSNYLSEQKRTNTECTAEWIEIESLYDEKSWTQLTAKMISLINHPALRNDNSLVQLYQSFISTFQTKIDPRRLVEIASVIVSFMSDKKQAVKVLESIEDTVKADNVALCHFYVLKGDIQLNSFNDLDATKKIIDSLRLVLRNTPDVYWKLFLLVTNYHEQLEGKFDREIGRLSKENEKFKSEIEKIKSEVEKLRKENSNFNELLVSQQESFHEKLLSVKTEIETKFTTEAVRNFEDVINSQTEISNLRKLNGRILVECSQLKKQKSGLEDDKANLEAKLEKIIAEQENQKKALLLMGAHFKKLGLTDDGNETGH